MPDLSNDDPPETLPEDLMRVIHDGRFIYYAIDVERGAAVGWSNCASSAGTLARHNNMPVYRYDGSLIRHRDGL
jgi:transposase InsO family protein